MSTVWNDKDILTAARMNQKTEIIDTASNGNPTTLQSPYAGMLWYDTTNNIVKFRNAANSAWATQLTEGFAESGAYTLTLAANISLNQNLRTTDSVQFAGVSSTASVLIQYSNPALQLSGQESSGVKFTIEETAGLLEFIYSSTVCFKMDTSGNVTLNGSIIIDSGGTSFTLTSSHLQNVGSGDSPTFAALTTNGQTDVFVTGGGLSFLIEAIDDSAILQQFIRNKTGGSYNIVWDVEIPSLSISMVWKTSTSGNLMALDTSGNVTLAGGLTLGTALANGQLAGPVVSSLTTKSGVGITFTATNPASGVGAAYYVPSITGNLVVGSYGITFAAITDSSTSGLFYLSSTTSYVLKYYDTQGTPVLHQLATLGLATDTAQTFGSNSTWNGVKIGLAYGGTNTDLSAQGGSKMLLQQLTSGGTITVATIDHTFISDYASAFLTNPMTVNLTIDKATPAIIFQGTEVSHQTITLEENGGYLEFLNNVSTVIFSVEYNGVVSATNNYLNDGSGNIKITGIGNFIVNNSVPALQLQGTEASGVTFIIEENAGNFEVISGSIIGLTLVASSGALTSYKNTLDDGSGNMTLAGTLTVPKITLTGSGQQINAGSGYIGFGTTAVIRATYSGGYGLLVQNYDTNNLGNTLFGVINSAANTWLLQCDGSGDLITTGYITDGSIPSSSSTTYLVTNGGKISYYSSSIKYKENVRDLVDTEWIYALRPRLFDWKIDSKEKDVYGFIAEEVEQINPKAVTYMNGKAETINYPTLVVPILVEMKKLRDRVTKLEAMVAKLGVAA